MPNTQQPLTPQEERTWAMLSHLLVLSGMVVPFGNIIAPLIIWQIYKDRSAYVAENALESLNFQITVSIALVVSALLIVLLIGIPLIAIAATGGIILAIIAGIKANNGEPYRYPFTLRLVK